MMHRDKADLFVATRGVPTVREGLRVVWNKQQHFPI